MLVGVGHILINENTLRSMMGRKVVVGTPETQKPNLHTLSSYFEMTAECAGLGSRGIADTSCITGERSVPGSLAFKGTYTRLTGSKQDNYSKVQESNP